LVGKAQLPYLIGGGGLAGGRQEQVAILFD
jgi:hypothetical protein